MAATERLVVDLPADLVTAVRAVVQTGAFASESDVLEAILRAWRSGDDGVVTVRFEDGVERRLMLEYAPLERI